MTINGAIMQLVEMRENSMMPMVFKPYFDKVIETISECEEPHSQPQWIPCSERLPSDHERHLLTEEVHYTTGRIIRRVLMAFYDDENDEWYEEMGEDVEVVSYPLAWMPLPEPWKEKKG